MDEDRDTHAHALQALVAGRPGRVERKVAQRATGCAHGAEAHGWMQGCGHCSVRDRLLQAVISHRGAAATTRMRYPRADPDLIERTPMRTHMPIFKPEI
jgi:hypothetical protein